MATKKTNEVKTPKVIAPKTDAVKVDSIKVENAEFIPANAIKHEPLKYIGAEVTKPGYYKPDLKDFSLGSIYMQKWAGNLNGAWRENILDEGCYDMSMGHCEFMSIVSNVKRTNGEFYRVKFLDEDDVLMLGFKKSGERGIFEISNCKLMLDWRTKFNVKVYVDDDVIYRGKVLCLAELKWVLVTLGILSDESRDKKFEQLGAAL